MFFVDACGANATEDMLEVFPLLQAATLVIFVSSTQGNGELPSLARKFFSVLFDKNGSILCGKHCAVLGFGSSSYPIFCGAASQLSKMLAKVNATEVVPHGRCDSAKRRISDILRLDNKSGHENGQHARSKSFDVKTVK